jgi:hypothetical protein
LYGLNISVSGMFYKSTRINMAMAQCIFLQQIQLDSMGALEMNYFVNQ